MRGAMRKGAAVAIRNIRRDSIEKVRKAEKDGIISKMTGIRRKIMYRN